MRKSIVCITLLLPLAFVSSRTLAGQSWTFCVASALATKDVWITEVITPSVDRERLEMELKNMLQRQRHSRVIAQCPQPSEDKIAVVNAQTTAEQFNSKL